MTKGTHQDVRWLLVGPGNIASARIAPALSNAKNSKLIAASGRPEKVILP